MSRRTPFLVGWILVTALSGIVAAQDTAVDPAAKELETLLAEHDESELGYVKAYEVFRPRFEAFADAHRGTEPEARATLWLIQETWWLRPEGTMDATSFPLAEGLLERHATSPQLDLLAEYRYVFTKEQRRTLFERLQGSPHRHVQAAAHFGLAQDVPVRSADGAPNRHLAVLLEKYAEVPWRRTTYGAIADAHLNPHAKDDLAVGKPAPEIEGIDHTGKPTKLSDYRGKVVLLDFWGHW